MKQCLVFFLELALSASFTTPTKAKDEGLYCNMAGLVNGLTPTKYMVNYCSSSRSTIYINSSLILDLTDDPVEERTDVGFLHCATNIRTDRYSFIYLHFRELDIAHQTNTPDRIHIYDFNDDNKKVQLTPSKGLYGVFQKPYYTTNTVDSPIRDYKSSGYKFRLDYLGKPTYMYKGFSILLTKVKDARYNGCGKGYFHCEHVGTCIPGELRCDGESNCGAVDNSDEYNCADLEETVTNLLSSYSVYNAVIAALVGITVFVLCSVCIVFYIRKYNNRKYPFVKARAVLRGGICTVTTNTDMERLYAPPSYECVMAGSSREGNDPPPEYSEYIRTTRLRQSEYTDSEDEDLSSERSVHFRNEVIDLHPKTNSKGKGGKPKKSSNRKSVQKVQYHDDPCNSDDLQGQGPSTSRSTSGEVRTDSPSSGGSTTSLGFVRTGDLDSENELKSGDSGIENSRERISKNNNDPKNIPQAPTENNGQVLSS